MNKLIKGTLIVVAAGAAALAAGFVVGVGTNLVRQVRAIKKDQALGRYIAEPLRKIQVLFEEYPNGGVTLRDFWDQEREADSRIEALPEGNFKTLMQAEMAKVSQCIRDLEAAAATKDTAPTTQEGEISHA